MSQVSGGELCFVGPSLDLLFDIVETALQGGIDGAVTRDGERQSCAQDSGVSAREEQSRPESERSHAVAVCARDPLDDSVQSQASQLVCHGTLMDLLWCNAGQSG